MIPINRSSPGFMPKNPPTLDVDAFTTVLAKATRKAGILVERSDGLALDIVHLGRSVRCSLATAYDAYRHTPDRLDDIVAAHLAALAALPTAPMLPTPQICRHNCCPCSTSVDDWHPSKDQSCRRPSTAHSLAVWLSPMS